MLPTSPLSLFLETALPDASALAGLILVIATGIAAAVALYRADAPQRLPLARSGHAVPHYADPATLAPMLASVACRTLGQPVAVPVLSYSRQPATVAAVALAASAGFDGLTPRRTVEVDRLNRMLRDRDPFQGGLPRARLLAASFRQVHLA
jgi:hypothetical protein